MERAISPLSKNDQKKRQWVLSVNNQVLHDVREMKLSAEKYGTLSYGKTPSGYDCWNFHEIKGGGVIVIPYFLDKETLYVGVVKQFRHNQGGEVLNVPRGFIGDGEQPIDAASREFAEETGFQMPQKSFVEMGVPGNPNSAFFETLGAGEGVRFFAVLVSVANLEYDRNNDIFKPRFHIKNEEATVEGICSLLFMHWRKVAILPDLFSNAAVARLKVLCNQ